MECDFPTSSSSGLCSVSSRRHSLLTALGETEISDQEHIKEDHSVLRNHQRLKATSSQWFHSVIFHC